MTSQGSRKRVRCGDCVGCKESDDCGTCTNCQDKPKFGGPGRKKQCCVKKRCTQLKKVECNVLPPTTPNTSTLPKTSTCKQTSAQMFAQKLINGQLLAPPGVHMPAVPLSVLQQMSQTDQWPADFTMYLS